MDKCSGNKCYHKIYIQWCLFHFFPHSIWLFLFNLLFQRINAMSLRKNRTQAKTLKTIWELGNLKRQKKIVAATRKKSNRAKDKRHRRYRIFLHLFLFFLTECITLDMLSIYAKRKNKGRKRNLCKKFRKPKIRITSINVKRKRKRSIEHAYTSW